MAGVCAVLQVVGACVLAMRSRGVLRGGWVGGAGVVGNSGG